MLDKAIIEHSDSPFNSPLLIVPKKKDASDKEKWRIVIDFRKLNEQTLQDTYPLPNIDEILDQLGEAKFFSAFDLSSGFHQIPMTEQDKLKNGIFYQRRTFPLLPYAIRTEECTSNNSSV